MSLQTYRVEIAADGCECCGAGKEYRVVDKLGVPVSGDNFKHKSQADLLAAQLRLAYALGKGEGLDTALSCVKQPPVDDVPDVTDLH